MSQTAKILEMKNLGFPQEYIASHLGINHDQVVEVIRQNTRPPKTQQRPALKASRIRSRTADRSPAESQGTTSHPSVQGPPPQILEVKPGFYVLTAEDLIRFASSLQEKEPAVIQDPYLDYVSKEEFMEQYGISTTTLHRHHKEGLLKIYKLGNKQYLKKSQVVKALEKGGF